MGGCWLGSPGPIELMCRSPMTTIPKFDLLQPHKCPGQKSSRAAALNFTVRHSKKDLIHPCGGPDGSQLDRKLASKLVYSRFKPVKSLVDLNLDVEFFASCAFSGDDKFLYAGTGDGSVKMFNPNRSRHIFTNKKPRGGWIPPPL